MAYVSPLVVCHTRRDSNPQVSFRETQDTLYNNVRHSIGSPVCAQRLLGISLTVSLRQYHPEMEQVVNPA